MALLEVQGLTKKFGGLVAVDNFNLSMNKEEIVALIGPNGAGKTTAFATIAGFYKPDDGKIIFNGEDITGLRPDQISLKGIVRTFQIVRPFKGLTVLDNVMVGAYAHIDENHKAEKKSMEILDFMGMADLAQQLSNSLPIAGRKRLEIARALATDPQLILFDECMAGLRPNETDEIIELVKEIHENFNIGILLVEHVMKVVMSLSQRVIVLHHGKTIASGTPHEVVHDPYVIDAYLGEVSDDLEG